VVKVAASPDPDEMIRRADLDHERVGRDVIEQRGGAITASPDTVGDVQVKLATLAGLLAGCCDSVISLGEVGGRHTWRGWIRLLSERAGA
jgi:hypothetical protein